MSLEHLLDLCLSQLNTGDADLDSVLARYPAQRAELEPMLRAALALRQAPLPQPRAEAFAEGHERLMAALVARLDAEALDAALAALRDGRSPEAALAGNPHADDILPLLRLAQTIQDTPEPTARWEAQAVGYARLIAAVESRRRFLDALDAALTQVSAGRPVADVIAALGDGADSLAPALHAALAVRQTPLVEPRVEAKAAGLARLRAAVEARRAIAVLLDRAVAEVQAGAAVDDVLARHAQHAAMLKPLLVAAAAVEQAPHPAPRAEAKVAGLARLQAAVAARAQAEAALDQAVADLQAGRADIPMLLARFPDRAAELEPMLLSAAAAMSAPLPAPRPRARAEGRTRLMAAVSERRAALVAEKLDFALARVRAGEAVETVLAADPAFAAELEPLLRAAQAVEKTPAPVINAAAMREGERRLTQAAQARRRALQPARNPFLSLLAAFHGPRGAVRHAFMAAVITLFIMTSTLVGVTRAAANSLPDEALYSVKLAAEQVQLALAADDAARVQLHLAFAQERIRELQAATAAGRDGQRALAQLPRHTESVRHYVDTLSPDRQLSYETQLSSVAKQAQAAIEAIAPQLSPDNRRIAEQIVGTSTPASVALPVLAPTDTPLPPRPTSPPRTIAPAEIGSVILPPTKTPAPTATSLPPVPTSAPVVINPTGVPAATQAPTAAPTEPPAPTATAAPTRQVIQPAGGRGSTRTPAPQPTATHTPAPQPTAVSGTAQPTNTPAPPPEPTATRTPAPQPTVIAPPTRVPKPTNTPEPADTPAPPPTNPPPPTQAAPTQPAATQAAPAATPKP